MKLTEYIKRLQTLQRRLQRQDIDPDVVIQRYSDYTTVINDPESDLEEYPKTIRGIPRNDGWVRAEHDSMTDEATKSQLRTFVLLCPGN